MFIFFFLKYDEIQIILIILNNINAVKITLSFNFFINNLYLLFEVISWYGPINII